MFYANGTGILVDQGARYEGWTNGGNCYGNLHYDYEIAVNTETRGNQHSSSITCLSGGGFVVSWITNNKDDNGFINKDIRAQIFTNHGRKKGGEIRVNSQTEFDQYEQDVAATTDEKL